MLDRFVINKTGPGKSLILVAYRIEQEKKVFETGTVALVEQVVCWKYNNHVQYTLHLSGLTILSTERIEILQVSPERESNSLLFQSALSNSFIP